MPEKLFVRVTSICGITFLAVVPAKLNGGEPRVVPSSINPAVKNVVALSHVANDGRNIESQLHSADAAEFACRPPTIHAVRNIYCRVVRSYSGTSNLPGKLARKLPVVSSREQSG